MISCFDLMRLRIPSLTDISYTANSKTFVLLVTLNCARTKRHGSKVSNSTNSQFFIDNRTTLFLG